MIIGSAGFQLEGPALMMNAVTNGGPYTIVGRLPRSRREEGCAGHGEISMRRSHPPTFWVQHDAAHNECRQDRPGHQPSQRPLSFTSQQFCGTIAE